MNIKKEAYELGQAIMNAIACYGEGHDNAEVLLNLQEEIYDILKAPTRVLCYREDKNIPLPAYQTEGAACCDLHVKSIEIKGHRMICHTGLHVALPEGYEMEIFESSSARTWTTDLPCATLDICLFTLFLTTKLTSRPSTFCVR